MQILEDRIIKEGHVKSGGILKVGSFLNHQMDIGLFNQMGREFFRLFSDERITKILTIEASGIGIACIAAQYFNVPVLFAKKAKSKNLDGELLVSRVTSYTYQNTYDITVERKLISKEDRVLIIDDFLARGAAAEGLIDIVKQAGAHLTGIGIAIEKGFQEGGGKLRSRGIRVESLAVIDSMDENRIVFRR
jgi:xanthine phosphoribosyltransferase